MNQISHQIPDGLVVMISACHLHVQARETGVRFPVEEIFFIDF